MHRTAIQLTGN